MKRSIIPGFIKRKSVTNLQENPNHHPDFQKAAEKGHQLSADTSYEFRIIREKYGYASHHTRKISNYTDELDHNEVVYKLKIDDEELSRKQSAHRASVYEGIFCSESDPNFVLPTFLNESSGSDLTDGEMVDQEDIIALTRHVRNFSDALNNLRNTFKESVIDGVYNDSHCQNSAHGRLSEVLTILKGVLAKYPPLHSPDILTAAANIIGKIKQYNYTDGEEGPTDFYAAIDQLALSFSSSVSDFLMGDKDMTSPNAQNIPLDQFDDHDEDEDFFNAVDYDDSEKFNESEDSLDRLQGSYDLQKELGDVALPESDEHSTPPPAKEIKAKHGDLQDRTDELDKTLLSIEGSVDIALQRTKVWAKYAKDIMTYIERRSHLELEFSRSAAKLASTTRNSIVEESYLPFQSIYVTALDYDIQFANNYHKNCQTQLQQIMDKLTQRQREHDNKRSKIKTRWKAECKRLHKSRENLRLAKETYLQKQKDLEKFNKQVSEGKDDKGFSIGKKKGQEDFKKSAEDSEQYYKQCVDDANNCQAEIEQTKADVLLELRQLVYQCDLTMKSVTVSYFQMMNHLLSPLPIHYRALEDSSSLYEEGQQFAEFVRLQQSTCNQAMCPTYHFESYRGEGPEKYNNLRHGSDNNILALSSEDFANNSANINNFLPPRRSSVNSEMIERQAGSPATNRKVRQAWGTVPRTKGSATDDTDSVSSRSLPGSPTSSPVLRKAAAKTASNDYSDDDHSELKDAIIKNSKQMPGLFKNQKLSAAAKGHKFRKLRSPSKCKECDSYVYFNGAECERCGIICHKKCLEKLAIKCGNKRLPRKMTTFGVDFHQHLAATKRKDIPYIIEKCIDTIDEFGLSVKGIYRVSGVKSKVEKLCQQFETGGDLVDLVNTPPHLVASVLKLYLRQLPEPLLTFKLYHHYIKVAKDSQHLKLNDLDNMNDDESNQYEDIISELHETIKQLPDANFFTAAKLIRHLKRISDNSEENQMNAGNLAIVFGPTLLRPEGNPNSLAAVMDMSLQTKAVELLVLNSHIFSVNAHGEVDIETMTGEKCRPPSRQKKHREKKKIPDVIPEHKREDSVSAEFSQELLNLMESSQKRMDEDKTIKDSSPPGQIPGQAINYDYDNLPNEKETDLLGDLPVKPTYKKSISTVSDCTADYESCHSRLDSVESILSGDIDFESDSQVQLPDTSAVATPEDEIDDDVWMNRFGQSPTREKQPLEKTRSSSSGDIHDINLLSRKKSSSSFRRLETTTYSFSLGHSSREQGTDVTDNKSPTSPLSDDVDMDEPSVWVKRDSRERQPVRKHLKTVNIKSTTNSSSTTLPTATVTTTTQPTTTTTTKQKKADEEIKVEKTDQKNTKSRDRMSSTTSTDSENDNQMLMLRVGSVSKSLREVPEGGETEVPVSPSKMPPPAVLPKPKRPLDKKSWTADLIKSKSQNLSEQAQPGSLNDKLLHQQQKSSDEKSDEAKTPPPTVAPPVQKRPSVKEMRTNFIESTSLLANENKSSQSKLISETNNNEKDVTSDQ